MEVWDFAILVNLRRELISLKINANGILKAAGVVGVVTLGGLGIASIGCLCLQGMLAPIREATLRAQFAAKKRRMAAEHGRDERRYKQAGYQDGYQIGREDGYMDGCKATRPVAYDKGYLDALDHTVYLGDSEEILQKLGISPEEHVRQVEEAREAARDTDTGWDILEKIFAKKPAQGESLLKPGTVPSPEPLRPDDVAADENGGGSGATDSAVDRPPKLGEDGDEAVRPVAQGLLDDSDTLGHEA